MSRSRESAKDAGRRFQRGMADYFAEALNDDRVNRLVQYGANDRGDIGEIRCHGQRIAVECKNVIKTDLPGWIRQAHREAGNYDALCGVVVFKRHGVGSPASQWVAMEARDLVALITGEAQEGRYE